MTRAVELLGLPNRRRVLAAGGAALMMAKMPAAARQRGPDVAPALQRAINAAAGTGRVAALPPGVLYVSKLTLPANLRLVGAGLSSRLVALGPGPMLTTEKADAIAIENIIFDGNGLAPGQDNGLIEIDGIADFHFTDCSVENVAGYGLKLERCGGRVRNSIFRNISETAVFSMDAAALSVLDNRIEDCGNNGIQIWRSATGDDGTAVRGNHISRIRADRGGDGPYGNGINVFRAAGVICEGNVVRSTTFSAIRYNSASDAIIASNDCADLGETAIYVEFGFQGASVHGNLVDGASSGISITNFDHGGRLASCSGNVLRNLGRPNPEKSGPYGMGIEIEADTVAVGNSIDHAGIGLRLGFGPAMRNLVAADNVIADCDVGIDVSVVAKTGPASILGNVIAGARRGAILGMEWEKTVSGDLIHDAAQYPQLTIANNQVK